VPSADFSFVTRQRGMFSYTGLTKDQVVKMREQSAVYAIESGRICIAAVNTHNIDYVADAIAKVLV
jgi:aromatic-amino-acid transaminase